MKSAIQSLVFKDLREHGLPIGLLIVGTLIVLALMLVQLSASEFNMGTMQIVRLTLITTLPLFAFILGNRLVAREYLNKTRLFVEALPIGNRLPLIIKFVSGWLVLSLLATLIVAVTGVLATAGEDINLSFAGLILTKTLALTSLLWSIAFCFSLCGRLRLTLYLIIIAAIYYVIGSPYLDESRFGPFALIDSDIFAFERDIVPWRDIAETLATATAFAIAGFALGLVREGSVAERLAKPLSRRDIVALVMVLVGCFTVFHTLQKQWNQAPYVLTGDTVLRTTNPPLAIGYQRQDLRERGEAMLSRTSQILIDLQQELGLHTLPEIRIWMDEDMDPEEVKLWTDDGVIIHVNFSNYDFYENSILDTVVVHGVFQHLTGNRAVFEPNHWITDGVSHWWGRRPLDPIQMAAHDNEVIARAVIAVNRSPHQVDLIHRFQLLADTIGHLSAEALAYTAVLYLEHLRGTEALHAITRSFISRPIGNNLLGTISDRIPSSASRFESITGIGWSRFMAGWLQWLQMKSRQPEVARLVRIVPRFDGRIKVTQDAQGLSWLQGEYVPRPDYLGDHHAASGRCVMKYDGIGPFNEEIWLTNDIRDEVDCKTGGVAAHAVQSPFASGDRVYASLQFEHPEWHWPVMLVSRRLSIP